MKSLKEKKNAFELVVAEGCMMLEGPCVPDALYQLISPEQKGLLLISCLPVC